MKFFKCRSFQTCFSLLTISLALAGCRTAGQQDLSSDGPEVAARKEFQGAPRTLSCGDREGSRLNVLHDGVQYCQTQDLKNAVAVSEVPTEPGRNFRSTEDLVRVLKQRACKSRSRSATVDYSCHYQVKTMMYAIDHLSKDRISYYFSPNFDGYFANKVEAKKAKDLIRRVLSMWEKKCLPKAIQEAESANVANLIFEYREIKDSGFAVWGELDYKGAYGPKNQLHIWLDQGKDYRLQMTETDTNHPGLELLTHHLIHRILPQREQTRDPLFVVYPSFETESPNYYINQTLCYGR